MSAPPLPTLRRLPLHVSECSRHLPGDSLAGRDLPQLRVGASKRFGLCMGEAAPQADGAFRATPLFSEVAQSFSSVNKNIAERLAAPGEPHGAAVMDGPEDGAAGPHQSHLSPGSKTGLLAQPDLDHLSPSPRGFSNSCGANHFKREHSSGLWQE